MYYVIFYCYVAHRDLHSFPTRRSSDLGRGSGGQEDSSRPTTIGNWKQPWREVTFQGETYTSRHGCFQLPMVRSEEHTSELQSLRHLVCRLLLEKKKKIEHKHGQTDNNH